MYECYCYCDYYYRDCVRDYDVEYVANDLAIVLANVCDCIRAMFAEILCLLYRPIYCTLYYAMNDGANDDVNDALLQYYHQSACTYFDSLHNRAHMVT